MNDLNPTLRLTRPRLPMHVYEVRPRKDHRGVDLISDVLPFGRLWYDGPTAAGVEGVWTQAPGAGWTQAPGAAFDRDIAAPDNHFAAGPYCRGIGSGSGRVGGGGSCPAIRAGIASTAGVPIEPPTKTRKAPPRRSFHYQSTLPYDRIGRRAALVSVVGVQVSSMQPHERPAITGSV